MDLGSLDRIPAPLDGGPSHDGGLFASRIARHRARAERTQQRARSLLPVLAGFAEIPDSPNSPAELALRQLGEALEEGNASLKKALDRIDPEDLAALRARVGEENFQKVVSISEESDASFFWEELLHFGVHLKQAQEENKAGIVFSIFSQAEVPAELRQQAEQEWAAVVGRGASSFRAEYLLGRLSGEATSLRMVVPMVAGTIVAQGVKTLALGKLAGLTENAWIARDAGAKVLAEGLAYLAEVPAFAATSHLLSSSDSKHSQEFGQELLSAGLTLGVLKIFSSLGQRLALPFQSAALTHGKTLPRILGNFLIPETTTFAGLWAANRVEQAAGWKPKAEDATSLIDTLASLVSLKVGGELGMAALGFRWQAFQRELTARAEIQERRPSRELDEFATAKNLVAKEFESGFGASSLEKVGLAGLSLFCGACKPEEVPPFALDHPLWTVLGLTASLFVAREIHYRTTAWALIPLARERISSLEILVGIAKKHRAGISALAKVGTTNPLAVLQLISMVHSTYGRKRFILPELQNLNCTAYRDLAKNDFNAVSALVHLGEMGNPLAPVILQEVDLSSHSALLNALGHPALTFRDLASKGQFSAMRMLQEMDFSLLTQGLDDTLAAAEILGFRMLEGEKRAREVLQNHDYSSWLEKKTDLKDLTSLVRSLCVPALLGNESALKILMAVNVEPLLEQSKGDPGLPQVLAMLMEFGTSKAVEVLTTLAEQNPHAVSYLVTERNLGSISAANLLRHLNPAFHVQNAARDFFAFQALVQLSDLGNPAAIESMKVHLKKYPRSRGVVEMVRNQGSTLPLISTPITAILDQICGLFLPEFKNFPLERRQKFINELWSTWLKLPLSQKKTYFEEDERLKNPAILPLSFLRRLAAQQRITFVLPKELKDRAAPPTKKKKGRKG